VLQLLSLSAPLLSRVVHQLLSLSAPLLARSVLHCPSVSVPFTRITSPYQIVASLLGLNMRPLKAPLPVFIHTHRLLLVEMTPRLVLQITLGPATIPSRRPIDRTKGLETWVFLSRDR